jgi:hypothetical protein
MDEPIEYMLTTVDNPYDPFTDFNAWLAYDTRMGYNTAGVLARVANVPDDMPESYQTTALQEAIDEIVAENISGMWRKVSRNSMKS